MSRDCPLQNPSVCKAYQCQQRGLEQKECVQSWASVCKHHLEILYLIFPARWSQRIKNFIHGFYWIGLLIEGTLKAKYNITSQGPVWTFSAKFHKVLNDIFTSVSLVCFWWIFRCCWVIMVDLYIKQWSEKKVISSKIKCIFRIRIKSKTIES